MVWMVVRNIIEALASALLSLAIGNAWALLIAYLTVKRITLIHLTLLAAIGHFVFDAY
jgi:hypothetical protein